MSRYLRPCLVILIGLVFWGPSFYFLARGSGLSAREVVLKENLHRTRFVIRAYYKDHGRYPCDLSALVEEDYLRSMPVDPVTRSADTWILEYELRNVGDGYLGISGIRSGAKGKASNGTRFIDW